MNLISWYTRQDNPLICAPNQFGQQTKERTSLLLRKNGSQIQRKNQKEKARKNLTFSFWYGVVKKVRTIITANDMINCNDTRTD